MNLYIAKWKQEIYYYTMDEYDHVYDLYPLSMLTASSEGNFYIGVVHEKRNGIQSAFVDIGEENIGFLPYSEIKGEIKSGEHILVQATHNSKDKKGAKLSMKFSLEGNYCVLLSQEKKLYFSHRIMREQRNQILSYLKEKDYSYGFVIRSGIDNLDYLWQEMERLTVEANNLVEKGKFGKGPRLVCSKNPLDIVKNMKELTNIFTDSRDIFEQAVEYVKTNHMLVEVHYREENYYLKHDLAKAFTTAMQRKIWLSSGGYLIIDKTEAMNVIDVNTGKTKGSKTHEKTMFKTNLEAAKEIARQIRLRNLSGIILVDFMDMKETQHQTELCDYMEELTRHDPIPTTIHGLTKLGIMEITRKKKHETLYEWKGRIEST